MTFALPLTAHEHIGFELGWDHAHFAVPLPAPYADEASPLRHGLLAGRAAFGPRTLSATPAVLQWLRLRLHAWLRGRSVERIQVTPRYLEQLAVSRCPITRVRLDAALPCGAGASSRTRVIGQRLTASCSR